ncbi:ATP-binding protein [Sorangium cellulosum]|uniref:Uncharacterized protein n=1 Tax=Sorangium cellulosum TaxID=56 RepID=A0A150QS76_SORCE|nr:ATP-binding protein [Sorangium cellulosum]KYF70831.1 hypothetical protein BE15_30435 [Sorangium cellulosum]
MAHTFPHLVCWHDRARAEVMNTIALDVRPSVFRATHHPSPLRLRGAVEGRFDVLAEGDYIEGFLAPAAPHAFDVAVGDSGTGKSHFVRWIYEELRRRDPAGRRYRVVLVPRSSANLADVVRRILEGFDGEIARGLRQELEGAQNLSLAGAKTRVLDEFAYVLEHERAHIAPPGRQLDDLEREVLDALPSLLHAPPLREELLKRSEGAVERIAQHVLGTRERVEEEGLDLAWKRGDLAFTQRAIDRAQGAGDLAAQFPEDPALADLATGFLNRARAVALPRLIRLRRGDLIRALAEVRRSIGGGRDLVLLIEDLSVTEGLDAELIEALLVRPSEGGGALCKLRSVVGVTNDDFARMRDNVKEGRIRQVVYFNVPVGDDEAHAFSAEDLARFAAGYLNATRHDMDALDAWAARAAHDEPLPSPCDDCRAQRDCHLAFGSVDGRGLYPLSRESLVRLYRAVAGADARSRAFNPRLLVGRVLNRVLDDAEHAIPAQNHPSEELRNTFGLQLVGDQTTRQIRNQLRDQSKVERLVRLIEMYSPLPQAEKPPLDPGIAAAFEVTGVQFLTEASIPSGPAKSPKLPSTRPPPPPKVDPFAAWFNGAPVDDTHLNAWRTAIVDAVKAWIDWDAERLALARSKLRAQDIWIDGQVTKMRGTPILSVTRSPEAAGALRLLTGYIPATTESEYDDGLLNVRAVMPQWADAVRAGLSRFVTELGAVSPAQVAASVLAVGAMIRGAVGRDASPSVLLAAALERWPDKGEEGRSPEWKALWGAYTTSKRALEAREYLADLLACSKGGAMGTIIDPTPVLPALDYVRQYAKPVALPPEAARWDVFKGVYDLAREVALHLDHAIAAERVAAEVWLNEIRTLVDVSAPKKALTAVDMALETAFQHDAFDAKGHSKIRERLKEVRADAIKSNAQHAETARSATSDFERLVALGKLDREKMALNLELLREADVSVRASSEKTEIKINALTGGDLHEFEQDIGALLGRLATALGGLAGEREVES